MAEAEPPLDFITNFFTDLSVSFFMTYSFYMSEAQTVAAIFVKEVVRCDFMGWEWDTQLHYF